MEFFGKTTFTVIVVIWSVLLTGHLQASPEEKRTFGSNSVFDLDKPNEELSRESRAAAGDEEPVSIDHQIRRKRTAATAAEQDEILRIHNSFRQQEGASDMYHLRWNGVLASMAQTWADRCNAMHGQPNPDTSSLGYKSIGQNLFFGEPPANLTSAIKQWFDEKSLYNFDRNSCPPDEMCGHYTQIVWSTTYEVGCGYTICSKLRPMNRANAVFFVCNYGPAGNTGGIKPYQIGAACTNCSSGQYFCNDGLCDNTCTSSGPTCTCSAACQNCGTATSTCSCSCAVGWVGNDCSKQCKDNDARCGANPGWPAKRCSQFAFIADACPAMCGKCVAGITPPCVSPRPTVDKQTVVPPQGSVPPQDSVPPQGSVPIQGSVPPQGPVPPQGSVPPQPAVPPQGSVPLRPDNINPASRVCLCVQGTNVAVRSTPDLLRSSVVRLANTNDCFRSQGDVRISEGQRWYKVNAAQGNFMVDGWIDGQYLTDAWCPASNGAASNGASNGAASNGAASNGVNCCNNNNERFSNGLATCCLEAGSVWTASSGGCSDSYNSMCTSLNNIRCKCLEEVILFRRAFQTVTRIIEGTESGGDWNHTNGYMLSLEKNQAIGYYVSCWFIPAGFRPSDGARQWKSPRGNTWIDGAFAWDVYCP